MNLKSNSVQPMMEVLEPRTLLSAAVLPPAVTVSVHAVDNIAYENPQVTAPDSLDGLGSFEIRLDHAMPGPVKVKFGMGGKASNGRDYVDPATNRGIPTSIIFNPGETVKTIVIQTRDDAKLEGTELATLILKTNGYAYAIDATAPSDTVSIMDDERPIVSVKAAGKATELNSRAAKFTISRTGPKTTDLVVPFGVSGTATPDVDYVGIGNQVVIPAGKASVVVYVTPIDDTDQTEGNETVILTLTGSPDEFVAVGAKSSATMLVYEHIYPDLRPTVSVVAAPLTVAEDTTTPPAKFTITRTGAKTDDLIVPFAVSGTATSGVDYQSIGTQVVIPAGQASVVVYVTPIDDSLIEGNETVVLTLSASSDMKIGTSKTTGTVTITETDYDMLGNFPIVGDATGTIRGTNYLGTLDGTWDLTDNGDGTGSLSMSTEGTFSVDPSLVTVYGYSVSPGDESGQAPGVYLTGFDRDVVASFSGFGAYDTYVAPVRILPATMSVGQVLTGSTTNEMGSFAFTTTFQAMERVGTLNCAKVLIQIVGSGGSVADGTDWTSSDTITVWLNDGVVKWQQTSSQTAGDEVHGSVTIVRTS